LPILNPISPVIELDRDPLLHADFTPVMITIDVVPLVDTALAVMVTVTEAHPAVVTMTTTAVVATDPLLEPVAQSMTTRLHVVDMMTLTAVTFHLIHTLMAEHHTSDLHHGIILQEITLQEMMAIAVGAIELFKRICYVLLCKFGGYFSYGILRFWF